MADWNLPTASSAYGDILDLLKALSVDSATQFASDPTNPITGMIKLVRTPAVKFQERGASAWSDLALSVSGGGTGGATAADARTNLGLGSMALQDGGSVLITGGDISGNGAGLTSLSASNLSSGTIPDARFPSTLPSLDASNLTALNASNLAAGTVPQCRKWSEATTSSIGNQDNFDFSGADLLRCDNSSLLTLRGLAAGVAGQRLTIASVGSGRVDLANQDGSSSASNRIINGVSTTVSLVAGRGRALLQYDGSTASWRVIEHEQGGPITPLFNSGDFTASGSMTWTVDSGDVATYSYVLKGSQLFISFLVASSSVGGTLSNTLQIAVPLGLTGAEAARTVGHVNDNSTHGLCRVDVESGTSLIKIVKLPVGSNFAAATNATAVGGQIIVQVS